MYGLYFTTLLYAQPVDVRRWTYGEFLQRVAFVEASLIERQRAGG